MNRSLSTIVEAMNRLAPLEWAESWDNVGLLIEPREQEVSKVLLTIDLTEQVLTEAMGANANLIIAYHPPIFSGLKRLTRRTAGERVVIDAIGSNIAVYSPHTALDAAPNGMNDWLARAFGTGTVAPIIQLPNAPEGVGMGRTVELEVPATLLELTRRIKQHLKLPQLRVATTAKHSEGKLIERVAVCAGAGGSIFQHCARVDLLLTGEMRHHDVLTRVSDGVSVILTDHTNTERGYLVHLKEYLQGEIGLTLEVLLSTSDSDPLKIQ